MSEPGDESTASARDADIARHLEYLQVERRVAERTLALYGEAFDRLQRFAAALALPLRDARTHHIRRFAAQMHGAGLAPRSIALVLSAWRGFYRWLGREGLVARPAHASGSSRVNAALATSPIRARNSVPSSAL